MRRPLAALLCALALVLPAPAFAHDVPVPDMTAAAQALLAALPASLRDRAVYPLESPERENWGFVPRSRNGLLMRDVPAEARAAVEALLRSGLSARGHALAETIQSLEDVLRAMEGAAHRDPGLYAITVFGSPGPTGAWGWRFEGHHLSLNFVVIDGRYASGTPAFFGANPAGLREGRGTGQRPYAEEEDLARGFLGLLDPDQRSRAVISDRAPHDIVTGDSRRARLYEGDKGLPVAALTVGQQDHLLALLRTHVFRHREEIAGAELQAIMDAGWERVHFAWAGSTEPGKPHYYRIQGPTFIVEYDNVQNGGDHVHSVWRDFDGDFGRDLLSEHHQQAHDAPARPE